MTHTQRRKHTKTRDENKKKITYWDAYDGTAIRVIEGGEEEMNTLDVEPSGEAFVSGGDDGLVKVREKKLQTCIPFVSSGSRRRR